METLPVFQDLGISLLLGLLVGIQREHADAPLGGVRTFPLVTVFGTMCALMAEAWGGWIVVAGLLCVMVVTTGRVSSQPTEEPRRGLTTAVALLLMFAVGAYLVAGSWSVAIAVGGAVAVLLQLKLELHGIVKQLSESDLRAIMQFVLISFIVLPVLPNQTFGWYDVLNPREIWLMVVLVVGISLGGYIVWRFFGQDAGIVLGGMLGGTISSTATTVSFARRSRGVPGSAAAAATVIMISTAVSLIRVIVEMAVVGREFLRQSLLPMSILTGTALLLSVVSWFLTRRERERIPKQENPTELRSALVFGGLYAVILLAVAATREHFQQHGLYLVAVLSGLTDMDAITLSTSRLVTAGRLSPETGWRLIMVGALANLAFKAGIVAVLGHPRLLWRTAILFSIVAVAGLLLIGLL